MDISEKRHVTGDSSCMVPQPAKEKPGIVEVDTTWGKIQPMEAAPGVRTVGELEVHDFQEKKLPLIDGRTTEFYDESTIPGAINIPHTEAANRMDELDRSQPAIFFCNGPQCPQSPDAIRNLLEAGYPADKIWYYRGGMHDWVTLGLPLTNKSNTNR